MKILIIAPKGIRTGGPESLHRLSYELQKRSGIEVRLWDPWLTTSFRKPVADYKVYSPCWLNKWNPGEFDFVVLPESFAFMPKRLKVSSERVFIWWLSVHNASPRVKGVTQIVNSDLWGESVETHSNGLITSIGRATRNIERLIFARKVNPSTTRHLFQSHYAQDQVQRALGIQGSRLFTPADSLSAKQERIERRLSTDMPKISYNGLKGSTNVELLKDLLPNVDFRPIKNLSKQKVIEELASSTLYVDLGHFPGRDRLPREAGKVRCPILIARRGAGESIIDFPVSDEFKVDLSRETPRDVAHRISRLLERGEAYLQEMQSEFFEAMREETATFLAQVDEFVEKLKSPSGSL